MFDQVSNAGTVAVIGAGTAGITCARLLALRGFQPKIFEKSRGIGGRLATRRVGDGIAFDHGAQYVTAQTPAFRDLVEGATAASDTALWAPEGEHGPNGTDKRWFVGAPAMNALIKPHAAGLDVSLSTEIDTIRRNRAGWGITTKAGDFETFDFVVCTAPAPQARKLLATEREIADALADVEIAPCWALMVAFARPVAANFEVWRSQTHDLAWVARNASKPMRRTERECWVIHAGPDWSRANLERDKEDVAADMLAMLPDVFGGPLPRMTYAAAHRWRYALTTSALGAPYLASEDRTLFVGGDWCLGARVEYAFESGRAIAEALIEARADMKETVP